MTRALYYPEASAYSDRATAAARAAQANVPCALSIPYGNDPRHKLDVYYPANFEVDKLPVLCFFHGGGWVAGEREWVGLMAPAVTEMQALLIAPSYRLAPEHPWPACFEDALQAVAWVRREISAFGGDPDRVFVGGHSAGAHLAAMAAVRADRNSDQQGRTQPIGACLGISGTYDMRFDDPAPGSMEARIQEHLLQDPANADDASPCLELGPDTPPLLLAWGQRDFPRIQKQGKAMAEAAVSAGVEVETLALSGCDHFEAHEACGDPDGEWVTAAKRWLGGERRREETQ